MARILVCDDDPDVVSLVRQRLQRAGHEVTVATNGVDALRMAVADDPDLVILDWMMPGLTGLEVCLELRNSPAASTKKLMMLTARAQNYDLDAAYEAGVDEYLIKPFRPGALEDSVTALLRRA